MNSNGKFTENEKHNNQDLKDIISEVTAKYKLRWRFFNGKSCRWWYPQSIDWDSYAILRAFEKREGDLMGSNDKRKGLGLIDKM